MCNRGIVTSVNITFRFAVIPQVSATTINSTSCHMICSRPDSKARRKDNRVLAEDGSTGIGTRQFRHRDKRGATTFRKAKSLSLGFSSELVSVRAFKGTVTITRVRKIGPEGIARDHAGHDYFGDTVGLIPHHVNVVARRSFNPSSSRW